LSHFASQRMPDVEERMRSESWFRQLIYGYDGLMGCMMYRTPRPHSSVSSLSAVLRPDFTLYIDVHRTCGAAARAAPVGLFIALYSPARVCTGRHERLAYRVAPVHSQCTHLWTHCTCAPRFRLCPANRRYYTPLTGSLWAMAVMPPSPAHRVWHSAWDALPA